MSEITVPIKIKCQQAADNSAFEIKGRNVNKSDEVCFRVTDYINRRFKTINIKKQQIFNFDIYFILKTLLLYFRSVEL
jgi:hypothetical protein